MHTVRPSGYPGRMSTAALIIFIIAILMVAAIAVRVERNARR